MKKQIVMALVCSAFLAAGGAAFAQQAPDHGRVIDEKQAAAEVAAGQAIEVGNRICPVSGEKIPSSAEMATMGGIVKYEYKGKIYNLCCRMCPKDFMKDPDKYSKIADDEVKAPTPK